MSTYTVRRLAESDRAGLLAFLSQDPANNLFLTGDVTAFGMAGPRIAFWGAFRGEAWAGAAMRLDDNACFYAPDRGCLPALLSPVAQAQRLSGEAGLIDDVLALLPAERVAEASSEYFCRLIAADFHLSHVEGVRRAVPADIPLLADLYAQGEAFRRATRRHVVEHLERQLAASRCYLAQADGQAVCAATAVAETDESAMIVSVLTAPAARNRGYAGGVVSALCADLLGRGKTPHLFYAQDNDAAGRVYQRIGFRHIGRWKLVRLLTPSS